MTIRKVRLGSAVLLLAAWAAAAPAGCGSQVTSVCDDMCDCTGCSEAEYEECVEAAEDAQKAASDADCAGVFETYFTCVEDELECEDDTLALDGCEQEEAELRACGVSVFRTVCELAAEKMANECGFGGVDTEETECTGDVACQSQCILDVSCQGLTGEDPDASNQFFQCINAC